MPGALKRQWERDLARFRRPKPGEPDTARPGERTGALIAGLLTLAVLLVTVWAVTAR